MVWTPIWYPIMFISRHAQMCSYQRWQVAGIPCSHVLMVLRAKELKENNILIITSSPITYANLCEIFLSNCWYEFPCRDPHLHSCQAVEMMKLSWNRVIRSRGKGKKINCKRFGAYNYSRRTCKEPDVALEICILLKCKLHSITFFLSSLWSLILYKIVIQCKKVVLLISWCPFISFTCSLFLLLLIKQN